MMVKKPPADMSRVKAVVVQCNYVRCAAPEGEVFLLEDRKMYPAKRVLGSYRVVGYEVEEG